MQKLKPWHGRNGPWERDWGHIGKKPWPPIFPWTIQASRSLLHPISWREQLPIAQRPYNILLWRRCLKGCPHLPSLPQFQKLGISPSIAWVIYAVKSDRFSFLKMAVVISLISMALLQWKLAVLPPRDGSLICLRLNLGWTLPAWPTEAMLCDIQGSVIKGDTASLFMGTFALAG